MYHTKSLATFRLFHIKCHTSPTFLHLKMLIFIRTSSSFAPHLHPLLIFIRASSSSALHLHPHLIFIRTSSSSAPHLHPHFIFICIMRNVSLISFPSQIDRECRNVPDGKARRFWAEFLPGKRAGRSCRRRLGPCTPRKRRRPTRSPTR